MSYQDTEDKVSMKPATDMVSRGTFTTQLRAALVLHIFMEKKPQTNVTVIINEDPPPPI